MFDFLIEWDRYLASCEKDIERGLRSNAESWIINLQTYCERLVKKFNEVELFIPNTVKMGLGDMMGAKGENGPFVGSLREKTGFPHLEVLGEINAAANKRKHDGVPCDWSGDKITAAIKLVHELTKRIYKYSTKVDAQEEFDKGFVHNLIKIDDEIMEKNLQYLDNMLTEKNLLIRQLEKDKNDALTVLADQVEAYRTMALALSEPYMQQGELEPDWKKYYADIGKAAKLIHEADEGDAWIKKFSHIMVDLGWVQDIIPDTKTADEMGFEGLYNPNDLTISKFERHWEEFCEENDISPDPEYEYDYIEEEGIDLEEEWAYFQGDDEYLAWENRNQ